MFIEITRTYRGNSHRHKMLINVKTIATVSPCDPEEYNGNTRIVLDREDKDGNDIVYYCLDIYTQVAWRIKQIFNPSIKRTKK